VWNGKQATQVEISTLRPNCTKTLQATERSRASEVTDVSALLTNHVRALLFRHCVRAFSVKRREFAAETAMSAQAFFALLRIQSLQTTSKKRVTCEDFA